MYDRVNLLVDYSNVISSSGEMVAHIEDLVRRVSSHLDCHGYGNRFEFRVRLYDGWDEQVQVVDNMTGCRTLKSKLSRNAQEVAGIIAQQFPRICGSSSVNVELARSLQSIPALLFPYTLRKKQEFYRLNLAEKTEMCCNDALVHYDFLKELIAKRRCCHCKTKKAFLYTVEQKLVDTMLLSDIMEMCNRDEILVVASDDDDMLPGIFQCSAAGHVLYHVRKRMDQLSYQEYCRLFKKLFPESECYQVVR